MHKESQTKRTLRVLRLENEKRCSIYRMIERKGRSRIGEQGLIGDKHGRTRDMNIYGIVSMIGWVKESWDECYIMHRCYSSSRTSLMSPK